MVNIGVASLVLHSQVFNRGFRISKFHNNALGPLLGGICDFVVDLLAYLSKREGIGAGHWLLTGGCWISVETNPISSEDEGVDDITDFAWEREEVDLGLYLSKRQSASIVIYKIEYRISPVGFPVKVRLLIPRLTSMVVLVPTARVSGIKDAIDAVLGEGSI